MSLIYRLRDGDFALCETYLKTIFKIKKMRPKNLVLAADFNIDLLDFENSKKVHIFANLIFQFRIIPTMNKPKYLAIKLKQSKIPSKLIYIYLSV